MRVFRGVVLFAGVLATTIGVLPGIAAAEDPPLPPAVTDNTAPTISIAAPANGGTYVQGSSLIANYSCADSGGSGLGACVGTYSDGAPVPTQSLGVHDFKVIASDGAGNITKTVVSYTIIDKTAPTITISTPAAGATYLKGDVVNAHFDCNDNPLGSGINTCVGTVADGSPINTSSVGTKLFTVTAFDLAGNKTVKTVSYRVALPPPFIKVNSPNGGQVWARGVSHAITWSFHDLAAGARLSVQLYKGATLKQTINGSVSPAAGTLNWVPSNALPATADYKIKITVIGASPATADFSDGPFALN